MITADTITDEQIAERVKEALARSERGADTQNDREFVRLYTTVMIPHMLRSMLSSTEDQSAVTMTRARLAEILNDGR